MITRNQDGYVIVAALMILCILTLTGTLSLRTSITETQISTNHYIHIKNNYAAESACIMSVGWMPKNLTDADMVNPDYEGYFEKSDFTFSPGFFRNMNFWADIEHRKAVDPSDGTLKILRYGDANGDYLNEYNFTNGRPVEIVTGYGTHVRGGESAIQMHFRYQKIFALPDAALRVNSSVDGNGVSGSIIGEPKSGSSCGDVADIMYDLAGGTIEYFGDMGDTPRIEASTGMYPLSLMKPGLIKQATQTIPASNNIDEASIVTSADDPGLIYITGSSKATNLTGYGILFVDGDIELAGNLDWHGIILVSGDITFSGGGTKTIEGAVVGLGDAIALNGSVDIQYDCELLQDLQDNFSGYKFIPGTWKWA